MASPNKVDNSYFGDAVASVPDADGDSVADLLIGATFESHGGSPELAGRAYLFSGADGLFLHELVSPNEENRGEFGFAVAGVSDANGDGRGDLFVGAPDEGGGVANSIGQAYLFSGADGTLLEEVESPNRSEGEFGFSVAGIPDANGDGRGDLLIGAPSEAPAPSPSGAGRAYLFSGAAGTAFSLTATDLTSLTVPQGGSIQFEFTASNGTGNPASGDLFFVARVGIDQVASGRILSGTLQPGQSVTNTFTQAIPGSAPPGSYVYDLNIGQFPAVIAATETFIVNVTTARSNGVPPTSGAWTIGDVELRLSEASPPEEAVMSALPSAVALEAAYPNPLRTSTTLAFALPAAGHVRLIVHDVLGREVARLLDEIVGAGRHEVIFDAVDLPSGVYTARLETGRLVQTQRLTLLR